jgi:hypothetical protein
VDKKNRLKTVASVLLLAVLTLILFQNCLGGFSGASQTGTGTASSGLSSNFPTTTPNPALPTATPAPVSGSGTGTTYYVSPHGNDSNSGTSVNTPWQSLAKIASETFEAGDSVLLEAGQTFTGCLTLTGTSIRSTASAPFTLSSYGTGQFTLMANCTAPRSAALHISGINGFVLSNAQIIGNSGGAEYGVLLDNPSSSTVSNITIQNNDISGFYTTSADYGAEIFIIGTAGGSSQIGMQNISILNNTLHGRLGPNSPDDNGVSGYGYGQNLYNVIYQGNLIYNIGGKAGGYNGCEGNGILAGGVNGAFIQNNVVHDMGANVNTCGGAAGLWADNSNNVTIQYNEVYNVQPVPYTAGCDWDGFDLDDNVTNSTVQYNYSHNNYGAGYLAYISSTWGANTYRYNLSVADANPSLGFGALTIADWSGAAGQINVYNNTFDSLPSNGQSLNTGGTSMTGTIANNLFRAGVSNGNSIFTNTNGQNPTGLKMINNDYWSSLTNAASSYFNWAPCSAGASCSGLSGWQSQTGQDPNAIQILGDATVAKINLPSSVITCNASTITSSVGAAGLLSCLGSNYQLLSGSQLKGSGLKLSASPYSLSLPSVDFFGQTIPGSTGTGFDVGL